MSHAPHPSECVLSSFFPGKSKEAEIKRINKELANIRSKFKGMPTNPPVSQRCSADLVWNFLGDKTLDGYQKKKYVCKLLFIFLLGHDIDFGHMEAVNLLSSNKYSEKQVVRTLGFVVLLLISTCNFDDCNFRDIYLFRS